MPLKSPADVGESFCDVLLQRVYQGELCAGMSCWIGSTADWFVWRASSKGTSRSFEHTSRRASSTRPGYA